VIDAKGLAQYALMICRQLDKLTPLERLEVIGVAASLLQVEAQREIRRQQNPTAFVEDEQ
jgi:hypothetical protein